jgi:hypothetical protein
MRGTCPEQDKALLGVDAGSPVACFPLPFPGNAGRRVCVIERRATLTPSARTPASRKATFRANLLPCISVRVARSHPQSA